MKKWFAKTSGIEFNIDTDNSKRYFIARIEPKSHAEKAGFLEQDKIISIDFKWIELYSLEELINLFKSSDGKQLL